MVKKEDSVDNPEVRKTILAILMNGDLNKLNASKVRNQLEDEMDTSYDSPGDQKKIRMLIKALLLENANKFSKYKKTTRAPRKKKSTTPAKKKIVKKKEISDEETDEDTSPSPKKKKEELLYQVTPELEKIVGVSTGYEKDIAKRLWNYIKDNNLQEDGEDIECDELLKVLSNKDTLSPLDVSKHLKNNLLPPEKPARPTRRSSTRSVKKEVDMEEDDDDDFYQKPKKKKK